LGCKETAEIPRIDGRTAKYLSTRGKRFGNPALGSNSSAASDGDVAGDSGLASDDHVVFEHGGSGDAYLTCKHTVCANSHVVPNLAHVVELRPIADDGFAHHRAVDAGSGTQFNPVPNAYAAEVRNLGPSRRACVGGDKSEPVRTQHHIGVQDAVGADDGSGIHNHTRVEDAARPDHDVFGELDTRRKYRTGIDARGSN
jgi:hypothetical protein